MVNILIGCTGSVATIKLPLLIQTFIGSVPDVEIQVVTTKHAEHFFDKSDIPKEIKVFNDDDEWTSWRKRGDPVLHIELSKWADVFVIAPLDANTLAKMANGLCDNLLTCTARAWEVQKPLVVCPAMNTKMYNHPLTEQQINRLQEWGYFLVPVIEKTLVCGDTGTGAMAEVSDIVKYVQNVLRVRDLL